MCYEGRCDLCKANKKVIQTGRKGKCCNDHIIKFSKVEKSLPHLLPPPECYIFFNFNFFPFII